MKLFTYAMSFFILIGGFVVCTEYGLTANMVGIENSNQSVPHIQNGKVLSAAYVNGKEVKGIHFGFGEDLSTLPELINDRVIVHDSKNICHSGRCHANHNSYPNHSSYQGPCGRTWNHWQYRRLQPVRNVVRFFHNRRPVRRLVGAIFCGRRC